MMTNIVEFKKLPSNWSITLYGLPGLISTGQSPDSVLTEQSTKLEISIVGHLSHLSN